MSNVSVPSKSSDPIYKYLKKMTITFFIILEIIHSKLTQLKDGILNKFKKLSFFFRYLVQLL